MTELKYFHRAPEPIEPEKVRMYGSGLVKEVLRQGVNLLIISNIIVFGGTYLNLKVFNGRDAIERHYAITYEEASSLRQGIFNIVYKLGNQGEELAYLLFEDKK